MYKKIFITVALIAVGILSYQAVKAFFSAQATSSATFTAGSIDISIESNGTNTVPFHLNNWMPGDSQAVEFNVKNNSTVPVTLSGEVNGTWDSGLGDQLVYVTAADYLDDTTWKPLSTSGHGTFIYANAADPSTLLEVPAGGIATFRLTAKFDENAGNEFQRKTYTADLIITAEQIHL